MGIKQQLKKVPFIYGPYKKIKQACIDTRLKERHTFIDRSKGSENLCIILAGYKEFSYDQVFKRIIKFQKEDMDICIISSGLYSEILDKLAKDNNWSYLYTKRNNLCLAQNIAITKFPKANYIFKLDEDVFITENFFDNMLDAYKSNNLIGGGIQLVY